MTDSPEARLLLRLQTTGSNTNIWGGYLDTNQQMLSRASKGYQAIAMTGDQTISWTNYSLTNIGAVRTIKLTGSLSAVANLVVPSLEMDFNIINSTGKTITVKTSAGTGIAVVNGARVALFCDAADVYQSSPTNISTFVPTTDYDITTKTYVDTAIAAATFSSSPGTLRITAADTTAKFLSSAITVSGLLTKTIVNPGANETLDLSVIGDGAGTVTSIAQSFTGGLISVSGSPVTTSGTLALTVAGTSGGIPYFGSTSTWASSAALDQYGIVYGGGAGATPVATAAGTTGQVLTATTSAAPSFQTLPIPTVPAGAIIYTAINFGGL